MNSQVTELQDRPREQDNATKNQKEIVSRIVRTSDLNWNHLNYWTLWYKSGANLEDYIKDSATNFAVVGALLTSFSWPAVIDPPDNLKNPVPFIALQQIASSLFLFMVGISVFILKDHQACTTPEAKLKHLAKFGVFIFTINPFCLLVGVAMIFAAQIYQVYDFYDADATLLICSCINMFIVVALLLCLYVYMICWTEKNCYGPDVEKTKKRLESQGPQEEELLGCSKFGPTPYNE